MSPGKLSAQAGHAYTDALYQAHQTNPELFEAYRNGNQGGSKVTLYVKSETQLINTYLKLQETDIPHAVVVDSNHVMLPHFDGSPVITALGIGPCTKSQIQHITKKFRCVE